MGRDVSRTVTISVCFGQRVNALGEFEDFVEDLTRAITPERATRLFRKRYRDDSITINRVDTMTDEYYLTEDEFLKYAHIRGEEQIEKEN